MAKERVTRKKINEFLWKFCYKNKVEIPLSKTMFRTVDGNHFISLDTVKWLIKNGYTEQLSSYKDGKKDGAICVAYSPTEKSWLGWSHRAATSFEIGKVMAKNHINCTNGRTKPGTVLKTDADCKLQAQIFADCVG